MLDVNRVDRVIRCWGDIECGDALLLWGDRDPRQLVGGITVVPAGVLDTVVDRRHDTGRADRCGLTALWCSGWRRVMMSA